MTSKSEVTMNTKSIAFNIIGWLFGLIVLAIGLINTFWGNDPEFGIMIVLLSFVYYPPVNVLIRKFIGFPIPAIAKVILGCLILWSALGVGELFGKIELMMGNS